MGYSETEAATHGGINLDKAPEPLIYDKGSNVAAPGGYAPEAEIYVDGYEVHERCGALGDCLGCNQPLSNEDVRRNTLIRRVMILVFLQLVVVAGECATFYSIDAARVWIAEAWWMLIVVIVLEIAALIILFVVRRKFPLNIIALFLFTIVTGYLIASVIVFYEVNTIIEAAVICMVLVGTLMIYTLVSRTKVKWLGVFLVLGLQGLLLWGLVWMLLWIFGIYSYWLYQLYCIFGIFLFVGFIVYDNRQVNGQTF